MVCITSFSKQAIKILLCFCIAYTPFFANASTLDGWALSNPVARGASTLYHGAKTAIINGAEVAKKSHALVTPVAKDVSKVLARGVAGLALSVAVEQLLGAVDWVLDAENNLIRYKENPEDPTFYYVYLVPVNGVMREVRGISQVCPTYTGGVISSGDWISVKESETVINGGGISVNCKGIAIDKTGVEIGYNSIFYRSKVLDKPDEEEKSIPLDTVSSKVIDNANSGDTTAQVATTAAAADIVKDAEKDEAKARPIVNQLEANAKTESTDSEATGQTKPKDPTKPEMGSDLSIDFPAFCGWAPTICEAAKSAIEFPKTIKDWWTTSTQSITDAWAWAKEQYNEKIKENDDTKVDIEKTENINIDSSINFGGSCPITKTVPVSFAGISTTIDFSYEWFCQIASVAKPVIITISAFSSALIIAGIRTEDD